MHFHLKISEHTCKDCRNDLGLSLKIKADKKSMKTILETSHELIFNSDLNKLFGFTKKQYSPGSHISEKVINIMSIDKVHLKTDCIDGSIVNGIRESILSLLVYLQDLVIRFLKNHLKYYLKK